MPPLDDLLILTLGVTEHDATPSGFALTWPSTLLSEMHLAFSDYRGFPRCTDDSDVVEMSARAVSNFVSTLLERAPSLKQLHLDSVCLDGHTPPGLRVVYTASMLRPAPYRGDLPYDVDHPLQYEVVRTRHRRERQ